MIRAGFSLRSLLSRTNVFVAAAFAAFAALALPSEALAQQVFACTETDIGSSVGSSVVSGSTSIEDETLTKNCGGSNALDRVVEFTAPRGGTYTFDTIGSSYDTVLSIHTDCTGTAIVTCNDDTFGLISQVQMAMTAGQTVLVSVDGFNGATGNFVLNVAPPPIDRVRETVAQTLVPVTEVEGSTFVQIGAPVVFVPDEQFESGAQIENVRVHIEWAKLGPTPGTATCPTNGTGPLPATTGNAAQQETQFRLIFDDGGGALVRNLARNNDFIGTTPHSGTTYAAVNWEDGGMLPSPDYGYPGTNTSLEPGENPMFDSYGDIAPFGSWRLEAATTTSGEPLCVRSWSLEVDVKQPFAIITASPSSQAEGSAVTIDLSQSQDLGEITQYAVDCAGGSAFMSIPTASTTCTYADEGLYTASGEVTDDGAEQGEAGPFTDTASASFSVFNVAPTFSSVPNEVATPHQPYDYFAEASDVGVNDLLTMSLDSAPADMGISTEPNTGSVEGFIFWQPTCADVPDSTLMSGASENHFYGVVVTDEDGGSSTQPVMLVVTDSSDFDGPGDGDGDGDGFTECFDNCPFDDNSSQADHDSDGFDLDLYWTSDSNGDIPNLTASTGGDVCDADDDNDLVLDGPDTCELGATGWTSSTTGGLGTGTDWDSDGCLDTNVEDLNDDNDPVPDAMDRCDPDTGAGAGTGDLGATASQRGWVGLDYDGDGCRDGFAEETDTDNDGVPNATDDCDADSQESPSNLGWTSNATTDHDGDGCRDAGEDTDDDNDNRLDAADNCDPDSGLLTSIIDWNSLDGEADYDGDGCQDQGVFGEDADDDGDGRQDNVDRCDPDNGLDSNFFTSNASTDHDADGCEDDSAEDLDDDNDQQSDATDDCDPDSTETSSHVGWDSTDPANDWDDDGCEDENLNGEDTDDDNDGLDDATDKCDPDVNGATDGALNSEKDWDSQSTMPVTDYDGDGCKDEDGSDADSDDEDTDDDNDTVLDDTDLCDPDVAPGDLQIYSIKDWVSTQAPGVGSDHDSDGCRDSDEDTDDDNDGVLDGSDNCDPDNLVGPADFGITESDLSWTSDETSDYDTDGCQDSGEDLDDDGDSQTDTADNCDPDSLPAETGSDTGWTSTTPGTDHDDDGCRDAGEDLDDDNDQRADTAGDLCPLGTVNWNSQDLLADHDSDGCQDSGEDGDDDNDDLSDESDDCPAGDLDWSSTEDGIDYDGDGCRDPGEDTDDDGDSQPDVDDDCDPDTQLSNTSDTGWVSTTPGTDHDNDGCQDSGEDLDDDNDQRNDLAGDQCPLGTTEWNSQDLLADHDSDGCQDSGEDGDDDNDGRTDEGDACPSGDLDWSSAEDGIDYDTDGCRDTGEDTDDDNDQSLDGPDDCDPDSDEGAHVSTRFWNATLDAQDHDDDGCKDITDITGAEEDDDDDNDGRLDDSDACDPESGLQTSDVRWASTNTGGANNTGTDYDVDGCRDAGTEDGDDDNDGRLDTPDACDPDSGAASNLGWTSSGGISGTDYDTDGCRDSLEDTDDDNDSQTDITDRCDPDATLPAADQGITASVIGWDSTIGTNDHDDDGCYDLNTEDLDDDNDLRQDLADACPTGDIAWMGPDYDSDGCNDSNDAEETDDDNDTIQNTSDLCVQGILTTPRFVSVVTNDLDRDGCRDDIQGPFAAEDADDDNDGVLDINDSCDPDASGPATDNGSIQSSTGWISNGTTDRDSDGCRDGFAEEVDRDNDGRLDTPDLCDGPTSDVNWNSLDLDLDHDADGCRDANQLEDADDDNDLILDGSDGCPVGTIGWSSNGTTDHDADGCKDSGTGVEDPNDDNDSKIDTSDTCPLGVINWTSTAGTDYDDDGCQDANVEDTDDDNDGVADSADRCDPDPSGPVGDTGIAMSQLNWGSNPGNDLDGDGCRDGFAEELDRDNDGLTGAADQCPGGNTGWVSGPSTDIDGDGCRDAGEDTDDDGDGVLDVNDACAQGETGWTSGSGTDADPPSGDGCRDAGEDTDDDNDGVSDESDNCPIVPNPTQANADQDAFGDACDGDLDGDMVPDETDNCPTAANGPGQPNPQLDTDGDEDGDVCDDNDDGDAEPDATDNCDVIDNDDQANMDEDLLGDACDDDVDGDGVLGVDEETLGLDDFDTDVDDDCIEDGIEVGGDPENPLDTDEGADEFIDALDSDSDNDTIGDQEESGLFDGEECSPGEPENTDDPADEDADYVDLDSDEDGVPDGEDNCRVDANPLQTNSDEGTPSEDDVGDACDDDSDGDGFDDDDEILIGTNPFDVDSDNDFIPDSIEIGSIGAPTNTDGTDEIDALDDDSDNDGKSDAEEAGDEDLSTPPFNSDGTIPPTPPDRADYRDSDSDGDGVADQVDNCRTMVNVNQLNSEPPVDRDLLGDVCDPDDDGDGVDDIEDNCVLVQNEDQLNTDGTLLAGDALGDACDFDDDADGDLDVLDNCPLDANADQANTDDEDDGGDVCDSDDDNDGADDDEDNCPLLANEDQVNTDEELVGGDGLGDECDDDDDADEDLDGADNCPLVSNADQLDTDSDESGDACDADDDDDGDLDGADNCPLIANPEQENTDGADDGGDACDTDADNDGDADDEDNCPQVANADQTNTDGDDDGNACDDDDDDDGVDDDADNCPLAANADQENTDGEDDGGDACDADDDDDTVDDDEDNCILVANEDQLNTDGDDDGGNACDDDDDGDGDLDSADNCPLADNADQLDTDSDDDGNVCDDDDDGDGVDDSEDNCPLAANPTQTDEDGDGDGAACDSNDATGGPDDDSGVPGDGDGDGDGDAGLEPIACTVEALFDAAGVAQPETLDRESIVAALATRNIVIPEDPTVAEIRQVLEDADILLPTQCDVEALLDGVLLADGGLPTTDDGCSCRTVSATRSPNALGTALFGGLMLVLAFRRRKRSR